MRIVGTQERGDIELDPVKAHHRGRQLDAAFKALALPHPRGVSRASRRVQAQRDDERMLLAARRVDAGATEDSDGLIDGLLKTKTDCREKDVLDKQVLRRIREQLERG